MRRARRQPLIDVAGPRGYSLKTSNATVDLKAQTLASASPVNGTVTEVNDELAGAPETVNRDPLGGGWLIRVRFTEPPELLDHAAYLDLTKD